MVWRKQDPSVLLVMEDDAKPATLLQGSQPKSEFKFQGFPGYFSQFSRVYIVEIPGYFIRNQIFKKLSHQSKDNFHFNVNSSQMSFVK